MTKEAERFDPPNFWLIHFESPVFSFLSYLNKSQLEIKQGYWKHWFVRATKFLAYSNTQ